MNQKLLSISHLPLELFLIGCFMSLSSFPLQAQDWNNCGGNSLRNGLSPIPGPQTPDIKWQGTQTGAFGFPVFIEDQVVVTSRYISLTNSPVVCHDLNTGQLLWTADVTNGTGRSIPIGIRDGKVYVMQFLEAIYGDSLIALDALTGVRLWVADKLIKPAYPIGCAFTSGGDLLIEGYLNLLRINGTDGSTVWETSIYPYVLGYLCPTVFDSTVYVQQNAAESITAMDINTGNIKYTIAISPNGQNTQTILMTGSDGILYAQTTEAGGQITAFKDDGDSLSVLWTTPTTGYAPFSYMAESPDSTIYVPSNGKILRLLKSSGAIIDSSDALGSPSLFIETISVGSDGKVYIATGSTFQCTNPDLTPVFTETIPDLNTSGCALGSNNLLAIAGSGTELRVYGSSPAFTASETVVCEKFCISFFDSSANNPTSWQWFFPGGSPSSSTDENPSQICYDTPGMYDVTLITSGPFGTDTFTLTNYITVFATPSLPTITQMDYTLTSSAAATYQWQLNSVDIPGATNQSLDVFQTGLYTVIIGDDNGCSSSASKYVTITGIELQNSTGSIHISPNPSNGNFTIEFSKAGEEILLVDIINTLGQKVYSLNREMAGIVLKKEIMLNVPRGIYFAEIKTKNYLEKQKIIVTW